jgi:hypothetical protein
MLTKSLSQSAGLLSAIFSETLVLIQKIEGLASHETLVFRREGGCAGAVKLTFNILLNISIT